jgi:hypothetical protein
MTLAERQTVIGQANVWADDWEADTGGASAQLTKPIPFHSLSTLYFVFLLRSANSFNDAAGDDETLHFNAWIRRSS